MRRRMVLCLSGLLILAAVAAGYAAEDTWSLDRTFADAVRAYDENRLDDSIAGWKTLLAAGQDSVPILYNLGNTYYRAGQTGKAILLYRRAEQLAPRDPDIRANLGFAAQTAGITLPAQPAWMAFFMELTRGEWRWLLIIVFWLAAITAMLWMLLPRGRAVFKPVMSALAVLWCVALLGYSLHRMNDRQPEYVVMTGGQTVLAGPFEAATPIMAIPEGAIVRRTGERDGWYEIRYDSINGWLPTAAVESVL